MTQHRSGVQILPGASTYEKTLEQKLRVFSLCAGQDLNLRSPKASDLQSDVIDHSTTDALSPT
jgi:hypothetical protein